MLSKGFSCTAIDTRQVIISNLLIYFHFFSEGGCVPYSYGGCRGTDNLYDTEEQCQATCPSNVNTKSAEVCQLDIQSGNCQDIC